MAEIDSLQIKRGLLKNLPNLADGEFGFTEDENEQRVYIGSIAGVNIAIPNTKDLANQNTLIKGAIDTSALASSNIAHALEVANLANDTAISSLAESIDTQSQIANIIVNSGDGSKDTEIVDTRIDAEGKVWNTVGNHIRNIDNAKDMLKNIQTYIATFVTSIIPIAPVITSIVDITKINIDVFYLGTLIELGENYTINTTDKSIVLNEWELVIGEKITYRVYM